MRIDVRSLDNILIDLVDCALLGADFYLSRNFTATKILNIKAIYPNANWHVIASWTDKATAPIEDIPISLARAEAIIKSRHKLHGGKI